MLPSLNATEPVRALLREAEAEFNERHRKSWLRARQNPDVYIGRQEAVVELITYLSRRLDEWPK